MTRYILISSGKGGTGKTSTVINLGIALNNFGKDVVVVDGNLTTPNIGLYLGVPIVPTTLHDVILNKKDINDSIYLHRSGTKVIPGSISLNSLGKIKSNVLKKKLREIEKDVDFVIIDCAAGFSHDSLGALEASDEVLVVTNPELPAVTDALKSIKIAEEYGKNVLGIILNRKKGKIEMRPEAIEKLLDKPIISMIPEDIKIKEALVKQDAVINLFPKSESAIAYKRLAANLIGEKYYEKPEHEEGFVHKFMKFFGLK
ncbi:MAG: cell division ATPase MinD [Nanoarchaeota archaeon]|nr:cell division ATPase MinD [Nanoarchaeota archaeon]